MSTTATTTAVVPQLLAVLREAFEGPAHHWTYFTDPRPEAGLFGTLATLSSAQASRSTGPGRATIAGHVHHLAFSTRASAAWIRGERHQWNWDESWQVSTVDDAQWNTLKTRLREEYQELLAAISAHALDSDESLGGALGALAHSAYHLAAIRARG
jgi:hypothetical protein